MNQHHDIIPPELHPIGHAFFGSAVVMTIVGVLPQVIAVVTGILGAVYYSLLIYEWFEKRRKAKNEKPPATA